MSRLKFHRQLFRRLPERRGDDNFQSYLIHLQHMLAVVAEENRSLDDPGKPIDPGDWNRTRMGGDLHMLGPDTDNDLGTGDRPHGGKHADRRLDFQSFAAAADDRAGQEVGRAMKSAAKLLRGRR